MKKNLFPGGPMFTFALFLSVLLVSCKKEKSPWYNTSFVETEIYNGTVIEYLESKGGYDSMILVLNRYPGLVDSLTRGKKMTFFAIPDNSFQLAIRGFNNMRAAMDSVPIYLMPYDLTRPDSGAFQYDVLNELISMYIFPGHYDYNTLAPSSTGLNVHSISGYRMNMKAVGESAVGSTEVGPKRIQLSDMNYSPFTEYWKSVFTTSVSTVLANNVLVHILSNDHQFGFASFNQKLEYPSIARQDWKPLKWISTNPDRVYGGTVFHAIDNDLTTEWRTDLSLKAFTAASPRPFDFWFIVDMGKEYEVGGFSIQHRNDLTSPTGKMSLINYIPTQYYVAFARDTASNLDSAYAWHARTPTYFVEMNYSTFFLRRSFKFEEKITARYFKFVVVRNWYGNSMVPDYSEFTHLGEIWMDY